MLFNIHNEESLRIRNKKFSSEWPFKSSKQVHRGHPDQLHSWKGTPVLAAKLPKFIQRWKFALEMLAPPASQAFVARLFSVCGIMTAGRRNRRRSSLEMRVWLKINHDVLNYHMPAR
jgi:hypothetical protein